MFVSVYEFRCALPKLEAAFFAQIKGLRLKSSELALICMHNVNETVKMFFFYLPTIFRYYFSKFKYIPVAQFKRPRLTVAVTRQLLTMDEWSM